MIKVLVLTAGFGDGHNTAARNLSEALEAVEPSARVEVVDLLRHSYGLANDLARRAYHGMINHAPALWGGMFRVLDYTARSPLSVSPLKRATRDLAELLAHSDPDCVITTYPAYTAMLEAGRRSGRPRPPLIGVIVTDSITVNAAWHNAPADFYVVPNPETASTLRRAGVDPAKIHAFGFPVSLQYARQASEEATWELGQRFRVLFILNHGTRKAGKTVRRLLRIPDVHLTVVTGRNPRLHRKLAELAADHPDRMEVVGWTDRMPALMRQSHLVITKAGGATVQEALAAGRPLILTQVVPGQEEGNAQLVRGLGAGAVAGTPRETADLVARALSRRGLVYRQWKRAVEHQLRPSAALKIARYVIHRLNGSPDPRRASPQQSTAPRMAAPLYPVRRTSRRGLLCDLHAHSTFSDGRLELPEVVSFYGRQGFDVLCLTDHIADPQRVIGRIGERLNLTLNPQRAAEYFEILARERRRAWERYSMVLLTGLEFNKEALTAGGSTHLLGIDLQQPIDPALPLPGLMQAIRDQDGLVIAPHPHRFPSLVAKNTLHLWNNRCLYRPLIDAWEIANRNHIFTPVGLERLPYVAGSDFHRPADVFSWKTLLFCDEDPEAIKHCVRRNEGIGLVYYHGPDSLVSAASSLDAPDPALSPRRAHARCPHAGIATPHRARRQCATPR